LAAVFSSSGLSLSYLASVFGLPLLFVRFIVREIVLAWYYVDVDDDEKS
jgi:hypothetical protein